MKAFDREFGIVQELFETDAEKSFYGVRFNKPANPTTKEEKEKRERTKDFYDHGDTNRLFQAYMMGYGKGKFAKNIEEINAALWLKEGNG